MAKDNDKGLYLPLKIDLNEWEKSLLEADADLQKEMRKMRASVTDLKLKYDVEIANAKVAGNDLKAIELENEKLNAILEAQKKAVESLNNAYQKSVAEKGADAKESVALANALVKESRAMERTKAQINARVEAEKRQRENELLAVQKAEAEKLKIAQRAAEEKAKAEAKAAAEAEKAAQRAANEKMKAEIAAEKEAQRAANEKMKMEIAAARKAATEQQKLLREQMKAEAEMRQHNAEVETARRDLINGTIGMLSPKLAAAKQAVEGLNKSLNLVGGNAIIAAKGLSIVGAAVAAISLGITGFEALTKHVEDIAKAGVAASDPIYQLRESLQSTYEDAEFLYNVTKVDGSSAESLKNALTKLDATLKNDKNGTNEATIALRKYGAELLNADGSVKGYREQLEELSRAARTAAAAGQYGDFKAALPGALRSTEFDHLLLGLDSYAEKAKAATTASKIYYDELHLVTDWTNNLALAKEHLNAVRGGFAADAEVENLKDQVDTVKALTLVLNENKEQYKKLYGEVGNITKKWTEFKGAGEVAFNSILADAVKLINKISELTAGFKDLSQYVKLLPGGGFIVDYIFGKVKEAKEQIAAKKEEVKLERELGEVIAKNKKEKLNKIDNNAGKDTNSEVKKQEAYIKLEKEMFELQASEYEKRIQQINDEKAAYIAAGVTEVDAARLFAMQKEKIDSEYYAKLKKEKETQAKQAEEMLKREIEMQKRAREEAISGAESTLRSNLKLIRYIQKQRNAGTYNEADAKAYADRLYMRQNGFKNSDISALKEIGVGVVQEIANARDRLFGQFANVNPLETAQPVTNNNNVTINFDNTVLDNVSAMDLLANKVAAIIQPAIQRAMQGQTGGSYGYTN